MIAHRKVPGMHSASSRSRLGITVIIVVIVVAIAIVVIVHRYDAQVASQQQQEHTLPPAPVETETSGPLSTVLSTSSVSATTAEPVSSRVSSTPSMLSRQTSSASSSQTKTSTSKERPQTTPQPTIAAAAPTSMTFVCAGKQLVSTPLLGMDYGDGVSPGGDIHPPTGHEAYYLDNFGVLPSSPSNDSTFVFGHAWTNDSEEVFNPISERAFEGRREARDPKQRNKAGIAGYTEPIPVQVIPSLVGCVVTVKTAKGVFSYETTEAFTVAKSQFRYVGDLAGAPGLYPSRLVIATCLIDVKQGLNPDWNVVIYAKPIGAKAVN